jgi:hypothetical protein
MLSLVWKQRCLGELEVSGWLFIDIVEAIQLVTPHGYRCSHNDLHIEMLMSCIDDSAALLAIFRFAVNHEPRTRKTYVG